jgi:hypothetical protein
MDQNFTNVKYVIMNASCLRLEVKGKSVFSAATGGLCLCFCYMNKTFEIRHLNVSDLENIKIANKP